MTASPDSSEESWKGLQPKWLIAMKFGQREHLEQFRAGQLFTKPLEAFAKMERDEVRHDRLEGASRITQPDAIRRLTLTSGDGQVIDFDSKDLVGPLVMSYGEAVNCNVFCMFSITSPANNFCDARNFGFGDSFVIVINTHVFLTRVAAGAQHAGFSFDVGVVEYYDERTFSGLTGPFRKPNRFAYQNEVRLAFRPGLIEPQTIDVGDLGDITSDIHPLSDINTLCDFSPDNAALAGLA